VRPWVGGRARGNDVPGTAPTVVALGVVAVWWFVLAGWVLIRAVRTQEVRAPSCAGYVLREHSRALDDFIRQAKAEGGAPSDCLTLLREGELNFRCGVWGCVACVMAFSTF
jgi:hypothetical protein